MLLRKLLLLRRDIPLSTATAYGITPTLRLMINRTLVHARGEFLRIPAVEGVDAIRADLALEPNTTSASASSSYICGRTAGGKRGRAEVLRRGFPTNFLLLLRLLLV